MKEPGSLPGSFFIFSPVRFRLIFENNCAKNSRACKKHSANCRRDALPGNKQEERK
jgi:hypothetical protein